MSFAERYAGALTASLQDDEHHHATDPLCAAALSDWAARDIGALLHRVKYGNGTANNTARASNLESDIARVKADGARLESLGKQIQELRENVGFTEGRKWKLIRFQSEFDTLSRALNGGGSFPNSIGKAVELRIAEVRHIYATAEVGVNHALAQLQREWLAIVDKKGRERNWIKVKDWPNIGHLFPAMAERVAAHSLAHYLGGICQPCGGTGSLGAKAAFKACPECGGSKRAQVKSTPEHKLSAYEIDLIGQMVAELESLESSHAGVASALLRRAA